MAQRHVAGIETAERSIAQRTFEMLRIQHLVVTQLAAHPLYRQAARHIRPRTVIDREHRIGAAMDDDRRAPLQSGAQADFADPGLDRIGKLLLVVRQRRAADRVLADRQAAQAVRAVEGIIDAAGGWRNRLGPAQAQVVLLVRVLIDRHHCGIAVGCGVVNHVDHSQRRCTVGVGKQAQPLRQAGRRLRRAIGIGSTVAQVAQILRYVELAVGIGVDVGGTGGLEDKAGCVQYVGIRQPAVIAQFLRRFGDLVRQRIGAQQPFLPQRSTAVARQCRIQQFCTGGAIREQAGARLIQVGIRQIIQRLLALHRHRTSALCERHTVGAGQLRLRLQRNHAVQQLQLILLYRLQRRRAAFAVAGDDHQRLLRLDRAQFARADIGSGAVFLVQQIESEPGDIEYVTPPVLFRILLRVGELDPVAARGLEREIRARAGIEAGAHLRGFGCIAEGNQAFQAHRFGRIDIFNPHASPLVGCGNRATATQAPFGGWHRAVETAQFRSGNHQDAWIAGIETVGYLHQHRDVFPAAAIVGKCHILGAGDL